MLSHIDDLQSQVNTARFCTVIKDSDAMTGKFSSRLLQLTIAVPICSCIKLSIAFTYLLSIFSEITDMSENQEMRKENLQSVQTTFSVCLIGFVFGFFFLVVNFIFVYLYFSLVIYVFPHYFGFL